MKIHVLIVLALCALLTPPAQAQEEPGDSLMVKERHRSFGIENVGLRLLAKVAAGTASGLIFTGMAIGVQNQIWEPTGDIDIGFLLNGLLLGSWIGFPFGVSTVDPYDSFPRTLFFGVIPPVLAGYSLAIASEEMGDIGVPLMYFGPIIGSLIASEVWRKPPQDRRVSFALSPTPDGGLSASTTLHF